MKNKQKPRPMRRPEMSVQQLTGTPSAIEALGKKWRVGFNDQDAKGALEDLVRGHHARRAVRDKRNAGGEEGELIWKEFSLLAAAGFYDTFEKGWIATLNSADGVMLFLQSLLMKFQPEVTRAVTEEIFATEPEQVMAAVEVVAPDFFAAVAIQKGYGTDDARAGAAEIAKSVIKAIAEHKSTFEETPLEPASPLPSATT